MEDTPELPPRDEIPECTVENIPNELIENLIVKTCRHRLCAHCDEGQWFYYNSGHTRTVNCIECSDEIVLMG